MLNFEPIANNVFWELAQHVLRCLPGLRNPQLVSKQNMIFPIFILTSNLYTLCDT